MIATNGTGMRAYELIARFAIPFNVIPLQITMCFMHDGCDREIKMRLNIARDK